MVLKVYVRVSQRSTSNGVSMKYQGGLVPGRRLDKHILSVGVHARSAIYCRADSTRVLTAILICMIGASVLNSVLID